MPVPGDTIRRSLRRGWQRGSCRYALGRCLIAVLLGLVWAGATDLRAQEALAPTFEQIDAQRAAGDFQEALAALQDLRDQSLSPTERADVLWRLAWTKVDIGEQTDDDDRQEQLYREALEVARTAVAADSLDDAAHLVLAIAAGRTALTAGTREKIELSRTVKEHADRAIALDPTNDGAYHARGRWHYEVASLGFLTRSIVRLVYGGLPDASYEQAAQDFQQAIDVSDRIVHRLELGRTYRKLDQPAEARAQLQKVLAMPAEDPDDPMYKRQARAMLDEME